MRRKNNAAGKVQRRELRRVIDFDLHDFYRSISRVATWAFAAVAAPPRKSRRNWSEMLPRDGRISRASSLSAPRRVASRREVQRTRSNKSSTKRGGRSLELAPNFFPITKEAHFMIGGSLFLLQRWRWSSCWGDPSISWLRKASCHVSVDPLVYYTVYILFFFFSLRRAENCVRLGAVKPSPMVAMVCDRHYFRYDRYWTSLPASLCGLKNIFANTWDRLIHARVNYRAVLKDHKKCRTDI